MLSLKSFARAIKLVAVAFAFVIFIASNASPAFAFGMGKSTDPTDGEASLTEVRKMSEKTAKSQPRSRQEVSSVAQGGLNGVQGAASEDKMIKDAPGATTVKDDIKSGIKSITGQD